MINTQIWSKVGTTKSIKIHHKFSSKTLKSRREYNIDTKASSQAGSIDIFRPFFVTEYKRIFDIYFY